MLAWSELWSSELGASGSDRCVGLLGVVVRCVGMIVEFSADLSAQMADRSRSRSPPGASGLSLGPREPREPPWPAAWPPSRAEAVEAERRKLLADEIDAAEKERGAAVGKPREKITSVAAMLALL